MRTRGGRRVCCEREKGKREEGNAKVDQRRGPVKGAWADKEGERKEGRTHPCRSSRARKWRPRAALRLRRSRALPKARSPSLHRERVPRIVRGCDRAHTHLCIQPCRTFFFFLPSISIFSPRNEFYAIMHGTYVCSRSTSCSRSTTSWASVPGWTRLGEIMENA